MNANNIGNIAVMHVCDCCYELFEFPRTEYVEDSFCDYEIWVCPNCGSEEFHQIFKTEEVVYA